jgi:CRISPR-associated endoribonuclease Cas6
MKQYRFKIKYDGRFSYSWGYAMYSAFLEQLNKEIANEVHNEFFFNQYITPSEWIINSEEDCIFKEKYFLHKHNTTIQLLDKNITMCTEQEMADKYLVKEPYKRNIRLSFLTPTTFKQDGQYVLYPTKDLIMQSLTNKWNQQAKEFILEDMIWDNCKISRYNLRSILYRLKGIRIQGFVGYVDLSFWGSESIMRIGNMICNYANYSGTGIKTTLGMGGTKVE